MMNHPQTSHFLVSEKRAAKILVADDDRSVRQCLFAVLRSRRYDVLTACDGNEALRLQAREMFDLIILDLFMPERDGLETISELRKSSPRTRILVISGSGSVALNDLLYAAKKLGAHGILAKPFSAKKLLESIELLLAEHSAPALPDLARPSDRTEVD